MAIQNKKDKKEKRFFFPHESHPQNHSMSKDIFKNILILNGKEIINWNIVNDISCF